MRWIKNTNHAKKQVDCFEGGQKAAVDVFLQAGVIFAWHRQKQYQKVQNQHFL